MEKTLYTENNLPIYYYPNTALHSFCICVYVKAGLLYEEEDEIGSTHFIEHIVFRNINKLLGDNLYKLLDKYGLSFNGATYKEFVQFSVSGAVSHFNDAAGIISMVFEKLVVTKDDIAVERDRIKAEIREDDDNTSLDSFSQKIVWQGTSLENSISGKIGFLNKMGRNKLCDVHRKMFSEKNVFLYVTGCVKDEQMLFLRDKMNGCCLSKSTAARENIAPVPSGMFKRNAHVSVKNSDYTLVRFSVDVDVTKYSDAELTLLYDILFSGNRGMIYQELSEKTGFIYSYESISENYRNVGNMYFKYEIQHSNMMKSIELVCDIFRNMKKGIGDELDYVKAPYTDNAYCLYDSDADFNWNRAYECHILNMDLPDINARIKQYEQVTPERIVQIAKETFVADNIVLTIKGNAKKINVGEIRNILLTI